MKKIIIFILLFALAIQGFVFADDVVKTPGEKLFEYGLIQGIGNGNLGEDLYLTRAHMVVILARLNGVESEAKSFVIESSFEDVPSDAWYSPYVAYAEFNDWTNGVSETKFAPNESLTSRQAKAFMLKVLGRYKSWETVEYYSSVNNIDVESVNESKIKRGETFDLMLDALAVKPVGKDKSLALGLGVNLEDSVDESDEENSGVEAVYVEFDSVKFISNSIIKLVLSEAYSEEVEIKLSDKDKESVGIDSIETVDFDNEGRTVLVYLEQELEKDLIYRLSSGEKDILFSGVSEDSEDPNLGFVEAKSFDTVWLYFDEAINISSSNFDIREKDTGVRLDIRDVRLKKMNVVELKVSGQEGGELYDVEVDIKDFSENTAHELDYTYAGIGKPSGKQSLIKAVPFSSGVVDLYFNQPVKERDAIYSNRYRYVTEKSTNDRIDVIDAEVRDLTKLEKNTWDHGQIVRLYLEDEIRPAKLYEIEIFGDIDSIYENGMLDDQSDIFAGIIEDTSDLELVRVDALSNQKIEVVFDDYLERNISIDNFRVERVNKDEDVLKITDLEISEKKVILTTDRMVNSLYELTVENVSDDSGNVLDEDSDLFVGRRIEDSIESAKIIGGNVNNKIVLEFNDVVDPVSVEDRENYYIEGVGYPLSAEYSSEEPNRVTLVIPDTQNDTLYWLEVRNVKNIDEMPSGFIGEFSFIGSGVDAVAPELKSVAATDSQTIKMYFDRPVSSDEIEGVLWSDGELIEGVLSYSKTDAYPSIDLATVANEYVWVGENENELCIRFDAELFAGSQLVNTGHFEVAESTDILANTDYVAFGANNKDPENPELQAVQSLNKRTIRVYFDTAIEDISKPVNYDPSNIIISSTENGTSPVENGSVDVVVEKIVKIEGHIYDLVLDSELDDSTSGAENMMAYVYIPAAGSTNCSSAEINKIQDVTQKIELDHGHNGSYVSELFAINVKEAPVDDIDYVGVVSERNTVVRVLFDHKMDISDVVNASNYAFVTSSSGKEEMLGVSIDYIEYDDLNNMATIYLSDSIENATDNGSEPSEYHLAIDGRVDAEDGINSIAPVVESGMVTPTGKGVVVEFAPNMSDPQDVAIENISINSLADKITVSFNQKVAFGSSVDFVSDADADDAVFTEQELLSQTAIDAVANAFVLTGERSDGMMVNETLDFTGNDVSVSRVVRKADEKSVVLELNNSLKIGTPATLALVKTPGALTSYSGAHNPTGDSEEVLFIIK